MLRNITYPQSLATYLDETGKVSLFAARFFKQVFKPPFEFRELLRQCYLISYKSLFLVGITGLIMGMVLDLQSRPTMERFKSKFHLSTFINHAQGLKPGSNVRYVGVIVGSVDDIIFVNDSILRVDMVVEKEVKNHICKNAVASIGMEGMMGYMTINIAPAPGTAPAVENGDTIASYSPLATKDMMQSLGNTNENLALLSKTLLEVASKLNNGDGAMGMLLGDSATAQNLSISIKNLKEGSTLFNENMEAMRHNFLLRPYFKKKGNLEV